MHAHTHTHTHTHTQLHTYDILYSHKHMHLHPHAQTHVSTHSLQPLSAALSLYCKTWNINGWEMLWAVEQKLRSEGSSISSLSSRPAPAPAPSLNHDDLTQLKCSCSSGASGNGWSMLIKCRWRNLSSRLVAVMEEKWALSLFGQSPIDENNGRKDWQAQLQKNFPEQSECWLEGIYRKEMNVHTQLWLLIPLE